MNDIKILSSATDEERILTRHVIDLAKQADSSGKAKYTCFLDERQLALCEAALKKEGYLNYSAIGGYDDAERRIIAFDGYGFKEPFCALVFNYREADKPSHRDFLGAVMSLEIKREMIGDILVGGKRTVIFVLNTVAPLVEEISRVGRCGERVTRDFCIEDIPQRQFDEISATVSSLRLDAVLSAALRLSREKTQELIKSKGVTLNHVITYEPSEKMSESDVFSVKGAGKFELSRIGGLSKKERIFISINKFK